MIELFDVNTEYMGVTLYHAGLVYRPTERVLILPTMWVGTHPNQSTGLLYAKTIQAFLHFLATTIDKHLIDDVIPNFEKFVNRHQIHAWMSYRVRRRSELGRTSPSDKTIENDAHQIGRFLTWVKERYASQSRGEEIPYELGKKIIKINNLGDYDMLKGVKHDYKVVRDERLYNVMYKPDEGVSNMSMARRKQSMGHEYLRHDELNVFINSFYDQVWKYVALTAYHTGMRPFELLSVPRYEFYKDGSFFTSDPNQLRQLLAGGQSEIRFHCLGKGRKHRLVRFHLAEWLLIMEAYEPLYQERCRLYQSQKGEPPPLHYLWFNRKGEAQHCPPGDGLQIARNTKPLIKAVDGARTKHDLERRFGHTVDFYSIRHSFATDFVIRALEADKSLRDKGAKDVQSLIEDDSFRKTLSDQMGHTLDKTTWRHYIHTAVGRVGVGLPSVRDILTVA